MKRLKNLWALILTVVMVVAMSMTAYAAEIVINDGNADGSTYSAYRLLDAEVNDEGGVAYSLNPKYAEVLKDIARAEEDNEVASYIATCTEAGSIRTFADTVYAGIKAANSELEADCTTTTNKFENIEQGYYLVVETAVDAYDAYSLVMLDTAGKDSVTVDTKEDVPTLVKKVKKTNDTAGTTTDWQDGADYDYNDAVPFKLTGTLPSNYASYQTYYYAFADKLAAGLTFDEDSVVVAVDGTTIESGYEVVTTGLSNEYTFEVRFANLKNVANVSASSTITVEYNAVVNENAVIGYAGNPNVAKLVFSNDPYYNGTGTESTSETPEDKVIVFTYQLDVNKVNAAGNPLKGAGFTLYKLTGTDYVAVGSEVKGADITTFEFKGLDAGSYKLVETTVPTGYNKAEDTIFTIAATYDTESDNPALTGLVAKDKDGNTISGVTEAVFTISKGVFTVDIENVSGILLPTTGGIGTTIFYIVGAALMITAVVLLIVKKRKSN